MTERVALSDLVEKLGDARVACCGDVMLDRFVHGRVERISPEAPIPVLRVDQRRAMLGGAGNVVRNLTALGVRTGLVAVVGDDEPAVEIRSLLAETADAMPHLIVDPTRQTSVKTRFIASGQQLLRADQESVSALPRAVRADFLVAARGALECGAVLILSDYGKGVLADGVAAALIAEAQAHGKPVLVDPKGRDFGRYRGADVITPNKNELAEATGRAIDSIEDVIGAARALAADQGFKAVLATIGKDGMVLVQDSGSATHIHAEARAVFDVSGAGDTVIATVSASLAVGATLEEAARLATVTAGIVVSKPGTAVAYGSEILHELHRQDLSRAEAKVLTLEGACDRVDIWRRQGRAVGFTNGCFDLLHPGHVSLLRQAKESCDRLIVGLNSDLSVKALKGLDRPIQPEAARAAVLASLATVDMVVVFAEDTPLALIEALRPDVLIKGADYREDQVVGGDLVRDYGGSIVLARFEPGFSTTGTIARMTR